jgi:excisionase family DNA binding protein
MERIFMSAISPRLVSTKDAAKLLSVSRWTVARMVNDGTLPVVRHFKHLRIDVRDIDAFIDRSKS